MLFKLLSMLVLKIYTFVYLYIYLYIYLLIKQVNHCDNFDLFSSNYSSTLFNYNLEGPPFRNGFSAFLEHFIPLLPRGSVNLKIGSFVNGSEPRPFFVNYVFLVVCVYGRVSLHI